MLTDKAEDRVFKALGDRTRRQIVRGLARGPMPVHAIAQEYRLTRPAISRHLRILKDAALVDITKTGRQNVYYLKTSMLREIEDWLNGVWARRLSKLKTLVEEAPYE